MKNYMLYTLFLGLIGLSCEEENLNNIAENQFVVEAFLYANEPINDIRIKTTFPLADEEDTSSPIPDAEVTLIKNGQGYTLEPAGDAGFYFYSGNDVQVETGDLFQLEVVYNGITARAETIVPTPTTGLRISQDTIKVPRLPLSAGRDSIVAAIRSFLEGSSVTVNWNNPNQDLYFMVVESVKDTIDPIFPGPVLDALERFRFVSEPTDEASMQFLAGTLVSFGTYAVKVYHINQEYAQLYENRQQDSRDLNEPPSNVENALGVFSAFNSQEVFFEVVREQGVAIAISSRNPDECVSLHR